MSCACSGLAGSDCRLRPEPCSPWTRPRSASSGSSVRAGWCGSGTSRANPDDLVAGLPELRVTRLVLALRARAAVAGAGVADGVDAAVDSVQRARPQPLGDRGARHAELRGGHDSVL